jgi:hypothetical protein
LRLTAIAIERDPDSYRRALARTAEGLLDANTSSSNTSGSGGGSS